MIKSVFVNGKKIEYDLQIKRVKNINLRVKSDGKVYVSASRFVSNAKIEQFVIANCEFIFKARKKLSNTSKNVSFVDGDNIAILGKKFGLEFQCGFYDNVKFCEGKIIVQCKKQNVETKKRLLKSFLQEYLKNIIFEFCDKWYKVFNKYGIPPITVKFRNMTSRWGSCQYKSGVLTFNYALVCLPLECIEYVVVHEFTHFLEPNHSKNFYNKLEKFFPDWKNKRNIVKETSIGLSW